jgi:hypothetical protein
VLGKGAVNAGGTGRGGCGAGAAHPARSRKN